jgi:tripartite-type tricarboxylate transporter receptor subunit TctC
MFNRYRVLSGVLALGIATAGACDAQSFPIKPIRIIVPFSAGGGTDILARIIAQKIYDVWGQAVVVDNRAGASGNIGIEMVAKSVPDGYTILVTSGSIAINPSIFAKVQYDPVRDFAPISLVANGMELLVVHPSVNAKTIKELVALAKAKPGSLKYATPGIGTVPHLVTELFRLAAGIDIVHVPYKGNGPATIDLLAGQVHFTITAPGSMAEYLKSGKLRSVAVANSRREKGMEDIPTFVEAGYPEVVASNWYGALAPAGTPRPVIDKLNREFVRIMELPDVRERFASGGYDAASSTPEHFAQFIKADRIKWQKVVKASGARVD